MKHTIKDRVEKFITPFLDKNGFDLILCEYVNEDNYWHLRLFIDLDIENREKSSGGISINDCTKVSRYLSKWLDREDFIKEPYTLEVCSKGFLDESSSGLDVVT